MQQSPHLRIDHRSSYPAKNKKNILSSSRHRILLNNDVEQLLMKRSSNFSSSKQAIRRMEPQPSIRIALRSSSYQIDEKEKFYFDEIFSKSIDSSLTIAEKIADRCRRQGKKKTLILLTGQYLQIHSLQSHLFSIILTELFHRAEEQSLNLFYSIDQLSNYENSLRQIPSESLVTSPNETCQYLSAQHSEHRFHPFLVTFHLRSRPSNQLHVEYQLLSTNDHQTHFAHLFLSWISRRTKPILPSTITSLLNDYLFDPNVNRFVYLIGTVKHEKQLKTWMKISRKLSLNKCRHRNQEEIWIDGPLSHSSEIWIDGPPVISTFSPCLSSTIVQDNQIETESVISSHCHLPVLPVFKDHSLLPFRSTLPRTKENCSQFDLRSSTTKLNEEMENLEKALERLVIPSNLDDQQVNRRKSFNRIDQLSSLISHDEKNKRLSRILSPTRFDQLFISSSSDPSGSGGGCSVPNSPVLPPRIRHHPQSSTPCPIKKCPKLFQRLFGFRTHSTMIQSGSPLITPLTVTLDSQDDLMPLTTSSTTSSSASGRASSSGYESMSNTILEDMIIVHTSTPIQHSTDKQRSTRKPRIDLYECQRETTKNSPMMRKKVQRQQRLSQLKHRQNELKLALALTKNSFPMDKGKTVEHLDSMFSSSPMYSYLSSPVNEEDDLEREIEHLERRLIAAKNHLIFVTCQKK